MEIIEFIGATLAYIALNAYIYYVIEIKDMTLASLNYRPWTCRTCLTFWTGIWISAVAALGGAWTFALTMASISTLDAVAKKVDEYERYGDSDDYED